jgi:parvulin-like peptidyl-prolyl isomerase
MSADSSKRPRRRWRPLALTTAAAVAVAGGVYYWVRSPAAPGAPAQVGARPAEAAAPAPAAPPSEAQQRIVAFIGDSDSVSRADLGEYLIPRCGPEKLDLLLKRRVLERACKARGLEVTAAEVEAALAEQIANLNVNRERFVREVLKGYHKNLYEWKEDVIRPRLMLAKLCNDRLRCSEQDLRDAFEAVYGDKVQCRVIFWPKDKLEEAQVKYPLLRDSEEKFAEEARAQNNPFAAGGGRSKPLGRHTLDPVVEQHVFALQPGQVSELLPTSNGYVLVKCDARIPADTSASFEAKRGELTRLVLDQKLQAEIPVVLAELLKAAQARSLVSEPGQGKLLADPNQKVLAWLWGSEPVTREELGEFLLARYGAERLDLLVNKRIIDHACTARAIQVSEADLDAELKAALTKAGVDQEEFVKRILWPQGMNLFSYREDVLRPKLQLTAMCRGQVKPTEEEVRMAFEAHYGEKVDCRIILWPKAEEKAALMEYARLRDSEEEFARKAHAQASSVLAAKGGKVDPPIARHTTGNDQLEREIFALQPGEVSSLIGTPEGHVLVKCDARIPADTSKKLETVRAQLEQEVLEKKTQAQLPVAFAELRKAANPRLLLKDPNRPDDLEASVKADLAPPAPPARQPQPGQPAQAVQPAQALQAPPGPARPGR